MGIFFPANTGSDTFSSASRARRGEPHHKVVVSLVSDFHFVAARHFSQWLRLSVSCPQWGRWCRSRGLLWAGAHSQPIRSQDWEAVTNQKLVWREPDRWHEAPNTLIRGVREERSIGLNLTAFNEPKPRHLLIVERGSMHCYVCIRRLKSLNVSDPIFICFRQLFCNNVLSNG